MSFAEEWRRREVRVPHHVVYQMIEELDAICADSPHPEKEK